MSTTPVAKNVTAGLVFSARTPVSHEASVGHEAPAEMYGPGAPQSEAPQVNAGVSVVTAQCVRWATQPGGGVHAAVVLRYALPWPEDDLVVRGLLAAGWVLVAAPVPALELPAAAPGLLVEVDQDGEVAVRTGTGEDVFVGQPQQPVTQGWVMQAAAQSHVPVLIGTWTVDLGGDSDLTGCARAGRLVAARGVFAHHQGW